jgi:alpha-methylacyl-CoA racemase
MVAIPSHLMTMFYGLYAAGAWRDERGANLLDGGAPFYDVYPTADGRHVAVGALEEPFYRALLAGLGIDPADADRADPARWPALRERLGSAFASRTQAEWLAVFDGTDACVAPVLGLADAPGHPQLAARGTLVTHRDVVQPAPAPRFSRTPGALDRPPPALGEHTDEVFRDWLGP